MPLITYHCNQEELFFLHFCLSFSLYFLLNNYAEQNDIDRHCVYFHCDAKQTAVLQDYNI